MVENVFEKNFWIKLFNEITIISHNYSASFSQITDAKSHLYDKFSYIANYNPYNFQINPNIPLDDQKKQYVPFFSGRYFLKNMLWSLIGYYGIVSLYCNLSSNVRNFHCRFVYQNLCFKKTFMLPLVIYLIAHKIYFSMDKFDKLFAKELEKTNELKSESLFSEKKKLQNKLFSIKKALLESKKKAEISKDSSLKKSENMENNENRLGIIKKKNENVQVNWQDNPTNLICSEKEKHFILKFVSNIESKGCLN